MIYLTNAFSVTMMRWPVIGISRHVQITRISAWSAGEILRNNDFISCYGHENTARHLRRYLKVNIPVNRAPVALTPHDTLIIARAGFDREYERTDTIRAPRWSFYMVKVLPRRRHGEDSR